MTHQKTHPVMDFVHHVHAIFYAWCEVTLAWRHVVMLCECCIIVRGTSRSCVNAALLCVSTCCVEASYAKTQAEEQKHYEVELCMGCGLCGTPVYAGGQQGRK